MNKKHIQSYTAVIFSYCPCFVEHLYLVKVSLKDSGRYLEKEKKKQKLKFSKILIGQNFGIIKSKKNL